jgi:hypothetical protein
MARRWLRVSVLLLALAATGAGGWRVTANELARRDARLSVESVDRAAAEALAALAETRASIYAYVAPGQADADWSARTAASIAAIRARTLEVDGAATAAGVPLAAALDGLDRLAAVHRRALDHARSGQPLLAGDIIFTDIRELLAGIAQPIGEARQEIARAASARAAAVASEQSLLAGGVLAVWIVAAMLLTPLPRLAPAADAATTALDTVRDAGAEAPAPPAAPVIEPLPPPEPAAESGKASPVLLDLATLCADLGVVSEAGDLDPLLARAAALLGATGLIVWTVTEDGQALLPAASSGYDVRTLERIGALPLSADNLTVTAFATRAPGTRAPSGTVAGAVAVPLVTPSGASGVLAAEIAPARDLQTSTALAVVIAAQLATLFPAPSSAVEVQIPRQQRA